VSVTQNLLENTTYHLKIVFEGSNTVTIINSNTVKAQYTFASIGSRPLGFGTWNGTCYFDNVYAYTETFGGSGGGNPPPVPPPTFNLPPPDAPVTSYANVPFYYHLNDHLGTTRVVTDQAGTPRASFEYWPFGEVKLSDGCPDSRQQFTGKLFDSESGLQYFGARYLSNDLTRFTSEDPLGTTGHTEIPQSWNRYSYSLNNPTNLLDSDGRAIQGFNDEVPNGPSVSAGEVTSGVKAIVQGIVNSVLNIGKGTGETYSQQGGFRDFDSSARILAAAGGDIGDTILTAVALFSGAGAAAEAELSPMARGVASESRVLKEMGLLKNTQKVITSEGASIPDALTDTLSVEVKDAKTVSNTRQLRIQTKAAQNSNRESVLVTGQRTKVSNNAAKSFDRIIRREDLGPK